MNGKTKGEQSNRRIEMKERLSRRELVASIGIAGATIAAGAFLSNNISLAAGNNNSETVTGSVYGNGGGWESNCVLAITIAELRTISTAKSGNVYYVTDQGQEGPFYYDSFDSSSADNTGTIIVSSSGLRFKRIFDGALDVKWFGARGDGVADDTVNIRKAIAALHDGSSLYFPKGEYIIDSGCLVIRGLNRVSIYGDGESSWIHPNGQGPTGVKSYFHTTVAIDQCSNLQIRNLRIESKGENWGNSDAGVGQAWGDGRTNFCIEKGGHALLVARSTSITVQNITARYCGSVGVMYFSSCDDILVRDCFANASSLGYAMYAIDNWCANSINMKRTYNFINCNGWKEPGYSIYSGKGGIVAEGDQSLVLNVNIQGGIFKNCRIGGDAKSLGCAVSAIFTNLTMHGVVSDDCLIGLFAGARGLNATKTVHRVIGCSFMNNKVSGVFLDFKNPGSGFHHLYLKDTVIQTSEESAWHSFDDLRVKKSSGIVNTNYLSGRIHLSNVTITGAEYGIYSMDYLDVKCLSSEIHATKYAFNIYGGGTYQLSGSDIISDNDTAFLFRTANLNMSGGSTNTRTLRTYITNNYINSNVDQNLFSVTGAISDVESLTVKDNIVRNGYLYFNPGSAQFVQLDEILSSITTKVDSIGLAGTNTFVILKLPKDKQYNYTKIYTEAGTLFNILGSVNDYGGSRGTYLIYLHGDVRASFPAGSISRVIGL
ncbi:glycosyl hydrolase family 28-related protein [Paenibacillus oceani]|uniref:Rhamnogalacturonase A/B/Epimerase-like pectate lyase domain-containing protein n=1 Tax=Paenibacillus oceani TaxID=2772510 RepID=A0A927H2I0_9BACL|nr:glycosyl hydrolase family 28-related protein [Paenibacillus oceani]MBD2865383.1 hypothetical protein [Paenibacillus oceani]